MTLEYLRNSWMDVLQKEEYFYLLIFVAVLVIILNAKTLWKIAKLPIRLVFFLAGSIIGIAVLWGVYQLFM